MSHRAYRVGVQRACAAGDNRPICIAMRGPGGGLPEQRCYRRSIRSSGTVSARSACTAFATVSKSRTRPQAGAWLLCSSVLLDGALAAQVDLKADRQEGRLIVQQASIEPDAPKHAVEALFAELHLMAA